MKKKLSAKIVILGLLGVFIITSGLSCKLLSPSNQSLLEPVTLEWWGTDNNQGNLSDLISDFQTLHPNINVNYKKIRPEEFESQLINALAEDHGPDIVSIKNTEISKYLSKLSPLPVSTKMAYQTVQKSLGIKNEIITEVKDEQSITIPQLQRGFIDVVSADVIRNNKIYGLPLSVDTLTLFYNKDLFNSAGIPLPPTTWLQFQDYSKKLTYRDKNGNLIQSGAALGLSTNVENYFDIVSVLMMQNGATMTQGNHAAFFFSPTGDSTYNPGPEAVRFYTDFANPNREVYSWNDKISNSIESFAAGKVAMMIGYQRDVATLEAKRQGKLNYDLARLPQIEGRDPVNYASYFVQGVSLKSKHVNESWNFIQFISTSAEAKKYLEKTGQPTALRSVIADQLANDKLSVFASQLLTANSWYQGNNFTAAQNAFAEMINSVNSGSANPAQAAQLAAQKIDQTL